MNVYDQAHSLATAVKESEEYKQFQARKKDIEGNPELEKALNDFLKQQFEMQAAQAMGQPMDPEALGKLQQLSGILMQDPAAAQYLLLLPHLDGHGIYQMQRRTRVHRAAQHPQRQNLPLRHAQQLRRLFAQQPLAFAGAELELIQSQQKFFTSF